MLRDKRHYPSFEQRLRERANEDPPRPDIVGYSRTVAELHRVNVNLVLLLRAITRNYGIEVPSGPVFPAEQLSLDKKRRELARLDASIAAAMKHTS